MTNEPQATAPEKAPAADSTQEGPESLPLPPAIGPEKDDVEIREDPDLLHKSVEKKGHDETHIVDRAQVDEEIAHREAVKESLGIKTMAAEGELKPGQPVVLKDDAETATVISGVVDLKGGMADKFEEVQETPGPRVKKVSGDETVQEGDIVVVDSEKSEIPGKAPELPEGAKEGEIYVDGHLIGNVNDGRVELEIHGEKVRFSKEEKLEVEQEDTRSEEEKTIDGLSNALQLLPLQAVAVVRSVSYRAQGGGLFVYVVNLLMYIDDKPFEKSYTRKDVKAKSAKDLADKIAGSFGLKKVSEIAGCCPAVILSCEAGGEDQTREDALRYNKILSLAPVSLALGDDLTNL